MRSLAAKPCQTEQPTRALDESGQQAAPVRPRFFRKSPSNSAAALKGQDGGGLAATEQQQQYALQGAWEYQQRLIKLSTALDGAIDDPQAVAAAAAASARELRGSREQSRRE